MATSFGGWCEIDTKIPFGKVSPLTLHSKERTEKGNLTRVQTPFRKLLGVTKEFGPSVMLSQLFFNASVYLLSRLLPQGKSGETGYLTALLDL